MQKKRWNASEIALLTRDYENCGCIAVAQKLDRSKDSVSGMARRLGLQRKFRAWKDGKRRCAICRQWKSPEEFSCTRHQKMGRSSYCRPCQSEYNKKRRLQIYAWKVSRYYGLSWQEFQEMYKRQAGKCAICHAPIFYQEAVEAARLVCVDHCHTTGQVRGFLCNRCNVGLGAWSDDIELMAKAIEYVRRTRFQMRALQDSETA